MIRVTEVESDSTGERQRFQVTIYRSPLPFHDAEAPVTDLPDDIRAALLEWLGGAK